MPDRTPRRFRGAFSIAKDAPIPYAASLERAVLPQVEDVVAAVNQVLGREAAP